MQNIDCKQEKKRKKSIIQKVLLCASISKVVAMEEENIEGKFPLVYTSYDENNVIYLGNT